MRAVWRRERSERTVSAQKPDANLTQLHTDNVNCHCQRDRKTERERSAVQCSAVRCVLQFAVAFIILGDKCITHAAKIH